MSDNVVYLPLPPLTEDEKFQDVTTILGASLAFRAENGDFDSGYEIDREHVETLVNGITRLRTEVRELSLQLLQAQGQAADAIAERDETRRKAFEEARQLAITYARRAPLLGHIDTDPFKAAAQAGREIASSILALMEHTP